MKRSFLILLLVALGVIGCRHKQTPIVAKPGVVDAETAAIRAKVPKVDRKAIWKVGRATNDLSLSLLKELINENPKDNLVVFPLSLAQDFALIHESSKGSTKELVAKILNVKDLPPDALASFHSALLNDVETDSYETLKMANAIWIQDSYAIDENASKKLNAIFGCSVQPLPQDLTKAKSQMNAWVSKNTNGMIKEIKSELTPLTYAMFLNALYFNGKWKFEFDERDTKPGDFQTPSGAVKASMMHAEEMNISAGRTKNAIVARFPFLGDRFDMVVIVPNDSKAMSESIQSMNGEWLYKQIGTAHREKYPVSMPRLDLTTYVDLKPALTGLGAGGLFNPPLDLSVLAPMQGKDQNNFVIKSVLQQARLKLNERGVEAAAVTESIAEGVEETEPVRVIIDRPFLYFIVHNRSLAIVLCGIVNDPTKS